MSAAASLVASPASAPARGRAAIDCIRRGVLSLRANWELVVAHLLGTLLVAVLVVAGFLPVLAVIGFSVLRSLRDPRQIESVLADTLSRVGEMVAPLLLAGLGALLIWTLACIVYCYLQAATFGVLVAADRQAPVDEFRDGRLFRTFSWHDFTGWGGKYLWRFFWFYNVYAAVLTLLLGGFAVLLLLAVAGGQHWGPAAGFGIGCGGAVPLFFLLLVAGLWAQLAQVDMVSDELRFTTAMRRALTVLGRRLGGVLLIFLIMLVSSLALGMVMAPLGLALSMLDNALGLQVVLRLVLTGIQWGAGAVLGVGLAATLVALVLGESRRGAPA